MADFIQKVDFKNQVGLTLSGHIHMPVGAIRAYAIYAPCFTCTQNVHAARRICQGLAERGIAALRLDFSGIGDSEGNFSDTNFTGNINDLLAAARFLEKKYQTPELMIGHSLGGTAAVVASSKLSSIKAVCTINSPCHPGHVAQHFTGLEETILWAGEADVDIGGQQYKIQKHFLDDLKSYDMEDVFQAFNAAILIFHAPHDDIVNIKNANYLFNLARHPKSFISLDTADHLIRDRRDADYIAATISAWSSRYIKFDAQEKSVGEEGKVIVSETDEGKFTQRVYIGDHILRADEPRGVEGGLGLGPSPYDFLLAGLGACTSMTLRLYAEHKGYPLEHTTVLLSHNKIHAQDCANCETQEGKVDVIERTIQLEGNLSQAQKESLLLIADKCPVHRTLTSEVVINTKLKDDGKDLKK
jgi:putative redox protein